MSRITRSIATLTVAILAAAVLAGCPSISHIFENPPECTDFGDGRCWKRNPVHIPVDKVFWEVDRTANALKRCQFQHLLESEVSGTRTAWNLETGKVETRPAGAAACMMGRIAETNTCHIVGNITEAEARITPAASATLVSESMYDHEVRHCNGWVHTDTPVRRITDRR